MSQTEQHIGKLRRVDLKGKSVEEWCQEKLANDHGVYELASWCDNWIEQLNDFFYDRRDKTFYMASSNGVVEIFEHNELDYEGDIYQFNEHKNGDVDFVLQFYNGGTCFAEIVEEFIDRKNN